MLVGVVKVQKIVTVVGGKCKGGNHKIGDRWEIESVTPKGIYLAEFGAVFPYIRVLDMGGEFSSSDVPMKIRIHCPDPKGIILEVEKIEDL